MIRGFAKVILWHKVYVVHCIAYVQIYISTLSKKKSNDFTKKYNIQIVEKKNTIWLHRSDPQSLKNDHGYY
jgi:hypothetical protein